MNRLALLLLLLLPTCLPALAGSLQILPWNQEVANRKLALVHGDSAIEIPYLHPDARSTPIKVPATTEGGLWLETPDRTDDEGKPFRVQVKIPATIKRPLLLILPDKKSKTGIRPLILDDSVATFDWGTFRVINLTPKPLVFRWDKGAKAITPGWKPTIIAPGGATRNMEIQLYLKEDLKQPLYSAVWEHSKEMRQLVFMVPSTDLSLGPVEFKFVPETKIIPKGQ